MKKGTTSELGMRGEGKTHREAIYLKPKRHMSLFVIVLQNGDCLMCHLVSVVI